jgi:cell division protein FtsW (lipid II flippase)
MTTGYDRRDDGNSSADPGPILGTILALIFIVAALPAILLGMIVHRFFSWLISRYLPGLSWRWSFLFWFLLAAFSLYYTYKLFQHGLQPMLQKELLDYVLAAKQYQLDLDRWPWRALWAETWPVWLRTLSLVPLSAFFLGGTSDIRRGNAERTLLQQERRRLRRITRAQDKARRRVSRPGRLPDDAGDMMTIGVPINTKEDL